MPRGRKHASNGLKGMLDDARRPDRSAGFAPVDVPGYDNLGETGRRIYSQFWRTRERWSLSDLTLTVTAARALEQIDEVEAQLAKEPLIIVTESTGAHRQNPLLAVQETLRLRAANSLRDAGLRGRDNRELAIHGIKTSASVASLSQPEGPPPWRQS